MTREELSSNLDTLIANAVPAIKAKAMQLAECGAEDMEEYSNNFVLPKLVFVAALEYEAGQYSNGMPTKEWMRRLSRLRAR